MLKFHHSIGEQASKADSLHVLGRGLGQHYALICLLQRVSESNSLVIGVNLARPFVQTVIRPALVDTGNPLLLPRHLTSDYSVRDRTAVYETPGFVILTSNVLVHDLLHGTLPAENVGGLLIFDADRIREQSNEHFALTLFRTKNKKAFIKAFSENATSLTRGFHAVEKLMRLLYVSNLSLWPRFHHDVKSSMSMHVPDLIDLSVSITPRMSTILSSLSDTVLAICEDLRSATRGLDLSELFVERDDEKKTLVHNFDDIVQRQLEGAEKRYSSRVRSLLSDLSTLRLLTKQLFELNAVQYYSSVLAIRATASKGANWLMRREAQPAILLARSRVWQLKKLKKPTGAERAEGEEREKKEPVHLEQGVITVANLESTPKWHALRAVLREIQADVRLVGSEAQVTRVMLMVNEQRMVDELSSILRDGNSHFMTELFNHNFPTVAARSSGDRMVQLTMTQLVPQNHQTSTVKEEKVDVRRKRRGKTRREIGWNVERAREEFSEVFREIQPHKSSTIEVLIWCADWVDRQGRGHRILNEYHPSFVILYNADLSFIRQVEIFKAAHPGRPVRLYILAYGEAMEEERFRLSSDREKQAFKTLIRERATMTILVNQEGREEEEYTQSLLAQTTPHRNSMSRGLGADRDSRLTGAPKAASETNGKVLVDLRELRSSLPMLLYKSSLKIVPLTLEVGDFILSKSIGIERKSIPDLFGSFTSGRLFNQAEALCRHYKHPCLLIEMDSTRTPSLTATSGGVPSDISIASIVSKMVMLLQQFPELRLLWAQGPHDAAEMFSVLKQNDDEPDEKVAMSLGVDTARSEEEALNAGPKALLRSLPGIDSGNMTVVMRKVPNIATLVNMSLEDMTTVLGSAGKASLLFNFVNEKPMEAHAAL
ncbi:ERCC4 domain containing protein [Gracilaria domingensis]|nr:ERCC4 domain containing protein [Gracilaria domingensis]